MVIRIANRWWSGSIVWVALCAPQLVAQERSATFSELMTSPAEPSPPLLELSGDHTLTPPSKPQLELQPCQECPPSIADASCQVCEEESDSLDWSKVPSILPIQRPGLFPVPGTGPGYYTALDWLTGQKSEKAPRFPFGPIGLNPTSFFDYDFRYLEDPANTQTDWSDFYKRVRFGEDDSWLFSTGGQTRYRYHQELNSRLSGRNNQYHLFQTRAYGDLWYRDHIRLFAEFLYADSYGADLPPLLIDDTGPDILNAFLDVKVGEIDEVPVYVRGGRQELSFGSQRLISALDWANTRRTFQGVSVHRYSPKFDVDVFWVQPVIPNPNQFDSVNTDLDFFGVWSTFKPRPGSGFDLYLLNLNSEMPASAGDTGTLGSRYYGDIKGQFLFDAEGMVQWGDRARRTISAQSATGGLGWCFKDVPWRPTVWGYYDFASGDVDPTDGRNQTFNQLFPFGHYYHGYLDLVARQNIHDLNFQLAVTPMPWIYALVQYHMFELDTARDALYNAGGAPIRQDVTGRAGTSVGNELDFFINFRLTQHQNWLIGYSKLFAGDFLQATGAGTSPELLYTQYSLRW